MTDACLKSTVFRILRLREFPAFFQLAREKKIISLEEAVCKMTGATAQRTV
jgi:N-acyl-D-aspartate/D-glutamate deacylase